jgi:GrpB-like predicted nucleotidyltransferase (UPF0157 family)
MAEKYSRTVPTPDEITRHYEWEPPQGEQIWVDGGPTPGPISVVAHDPAWPQTYAIIAGRIRAALAERVIDLDHIGSTSVPGLAAKPVIDIDLTVADSSHEADYVPALEAVGFRFVLCESGWHEHRLLTHHDPPTHLHVFSPDCPEVIRHRMFRDWLIEHPDDLALYRDAKLEYGVQLAQAAGHPRDLRPHVPRQRPHLTPRSRRRRATKVALHASTRRPLDRSLPIAWAVSARTVPSAHFIDTAAPLTSSPR